MIREYKIGNRSAQLLLLLLGACASSPPAQVGATPPKAQVGNIPAAETADAKSAVAQPDDAPIGSPHDEPPQEAPNDATTASTCVTQELRKRCLDLMSQPWTEDDQHLSLLDECTQASTRCFEEGEKSLEEGDATSAFHHYSAASALAPREMQPVRRSRFRLGQLPSLSVSAKNDKDSQTAALCYYAGALSYRMWCSPIYSEDLARIARGAACGDPVPCPDGLQTKFTPDSVDSQTLSLLWSISCQFEVPADAATLFKGVPWLRRPKSCVRK